ncbi:unnamed protein product [Fusarium graminearum]|nr:hypothetical protein FG05_04931 [Fusarium graminearum]CAG1969506.1 unnamed protein product [Fusarium graminearum]
MTSVSTHPFVDQLPVNGATCASRAEETLAQLDGLFAGFVFLHEIEPATTCTNSLRNGRSRQPQVGRAPWINTTDGQPCRARDMAWSSIRAIRNEMETLWSQFVNVAGNLENVAVNRILADYQDAKGLQQTGAVALRNIFSGPVPNDLRKVFAFCCLSYVASHLLCARNMLAQGDILAGLRQWLYALDREDEREAFKLLVQHLWPEAQHHLHSMDSVHPFQSGTIDPSLINIQPTVMSPINIQNSAYPQQDPEFSLDLLDISNLDLGSQSHHLQGYDPRPSCPFIRSWTPMQLPYDASRQSPYDADPPFSIPSNDPETSNHLQQTSVFRAVLQYVQENADFWYNIAGRGLVSRDFRECLAWSQERLSRKMEIQRSFIHPLLLEKAKRDLVSRGIITIIEAFVERGLLQKRQEIEFYIQLAGTVRNNKPQNSSLANCFQCLFDDQVSFREFCDWIYGFRQTSPPLSVPMMQTSTSEFVNPSHVLCKKSADKLLESPTHVACVGTEVLDPAI